MPIRIQQRRTKGWRKPEGAIVVSRPSFWGNPFRIQDMRPDIDPRKTACTRYAAWLSGVDFPQASAEHRKDIRARLPELLGTDLCCWCKPGELCHGDLLVELANWDLVAGRPHREPRVGPGSSQQFLHGPRDRLTVTRPMQRGQDLQGLANRRLRHHRRQPPST